MATFQGLYQEPYIRFEGSEGCTEAPNLLARGCYTLPPWSRPQVVLVLDSGLAGSSRTTVWLAQLLQLHAHHELPFRRGLKDDKERHRASGSSMAGRQPCSGGGFSEGSAAEAASSPFSSASPCRPRARPAKLNIYIYKYTYIQNFNQYGNQ